ncbi:uncharacterized protein LOC132554228 [Ylistrum balloti]|uniref:uncharacterized protein LOC132554228 n=1 Tax=Ylistrum balloti TaxID=509963 RepID=UPI002905A02A|nr:uncharacterized protein LOC132554228 [Ylistrum balloti]
MSDAFLGTWEGTTPCGEAKGFDEFCEEMKTPEKMIKEFSKTVFSLALRKKDDSRWDIDMIIDGKVAKSTEFTSGKEFDTVGLDGKEYKILLVMNDTEMTENAVPKDGSSAGSKTTRTIKDGIMTVKSSANSNPNKCMTFTMKKK